MYLDHPLGTIDNANLIVSRNIYLHINPCYSVVLLFFFIMMHHESFGHDLSLKNSKH